MTRRTSRRSGCGSRALRDLPALTAAFARGELAFSAIRELTRIATPETKTRWRDAAAGKNVREIEDLVAGHRRGDEPDDPAAPEARTHVVRLELGAEVFARLRQVRAALTGERARHERTASKFSLPPLNSPIGPILEAQPDAGAERQVRDYREHAGHRGHDDDDQRRPSGSRLPPPRSASSPPP